MLPISLPTDNLYKFIALFSLLIYWIGHFTSVTQKSEFIRERMEIAMIEINALDSIVLMILINCAIRNGLIKN